DRISSAKQPRSAYASGCGSRSTSTHSSTSCAGRRRRRTTPPKSGRLPGRSVDRPYRAKMPRRRGPTPPPKRRSPLRATPAIVVVALFVALAATAGLASRPAAPSATPPVATLSAGAVPSGPAETPGPLHLYAADQETTFLSSCVADLPPGNVPQPVAEAFCICTLNSYETMYPTYDALRAAQTSGALTDATRTQI